MPKRNKLTRTVAFSDKMTVRRKEKSRQIEVKSKYLITHIEKVTFQRDSQLA